MHEVVEIIGWIAIIGGILYASLLHMQAKYRAKNAPSELDRKIADKEHKEHLIMRVYAYEYEEELCSMFAKVAKIQSGAYTLDFTTTLSSNEIISELSRLKNISLSEAEKIFNQLRKHQVLMGCTKPNQFYPWILGTWNCYWYVISRNDLNINKWMISHGYKNPKDNLKYYEQQHI